MLIAHAFYRNTSFIFESVCVPIKLDNINKHFFYEKGIELGRKIAYDAMRVGIHFNKSDLSEINYYLGFNFIESMKTEFGWSNPVLTKIGGEKGVDSEQLESFDRGFQEGIKNFSLLILLESCFSLGFLLRTLFEKKT